MDAAQLVAETIREYLEKYPNEVNLLLALTSSFSFLREIF